MDEVRRLNDLWSWLPAFRAVAESEHLPTASAALNISASSLSRAIRLLEDRVGKPLFLREKGNLYLNEEGARVLAALRDAMCGLDDALVEVQREHLTGPVRVSAQTSLSLMLVPALARLRQTHPDLVPEVLSLNASDANERLSRGTLDLALTDGPNPQRKLLIEQVIPLRPGVYCGPSHPLYAREEVSLEELEEHAFVVPPEGSTDHWPPHLPRKVGMRVNQLQLGVMVCGSTDLLAVLPGVVAEVVGGPYGEGPRLRRLPVEVCPPVWLHSVRRPPVGAFDRAQAVLDVLRAELSARASLPAPAPGLKEKGKIPSGGQPE